MIFAATHYAISRSRLLPIASGIFQYSNVSSSNALAPIRTIQNLIKIETQRFDIPDMQPLQSDPKTLLEEWQRKLALKFDANGKIVPMYPVEVARSDGRRE